MAFDLSTATPVDSTSAEGSSLLPGANEFPEIKKRAKQYKETEAERTAAVPTPNLAESAKLVPGVASDAASQVGNLGQGAFNYIKENPLAVPEAYLAYKGGQAVYKNLKEKFFGKKTTAAPESELFAKIEPDLNVSNKPVVNEPMLDMAPSPAPTQTTETVNPVQAMKNKLLASETKEQFIQRQFGPRYNANPTEPAFFPVKPNVPPIGSETPPVTPEAPVTPESPKDLTTGPQTKPVVPSEAPKESALSERVQNAAAAVPPEVQAKYAPEGKVVLKGYGSGDVSITNTYGKKAYSAIIDYFNNGQPIGTDENYKKVQAKINKGIPPSLAPYFSEKLPASEAEAGTFGSKELGEKIGYTPEGKVVTSPNAIKNAVAKGGSIAMVLSVADAVHAAQEGDYSKAKNLPFAAIPGVGANLGLYHGEAGAPTITQNPEVLKRPEVRQTLENFRKTLSPAEYEKAAKQYLDKVSSFSGMTERERLMADIQSPYRQLPSRNTLLPVAPPR